MEETGRLEPKEEEEMMMILLLRGGAPAVAVAVVVVVAVAVGVVVEEQREVMVNIVGALYVGSHVMESMGLMGDDRIKLIVNLWFC